MIKQTVRWTLATLCAFVFLQVGRAQAQSVAPPLFGDAGHLSVSGERLFGYAHSAETEKGTVADTTFTSNTVSILGNPATAVASIFTFPRVGFDYFASQGVSIGASLSYFRISQNVGSAGAAAFGDVTVSGFALAPRVGFAARVSPTVSIWPRAGITYLSFSNETTVSSSTGSTSTTTTHLFDLTVEAPIAFEILPRVVLMIGPTFDLGLSGSTKSGDSATGNDVKVTEFGVQAGLLFVI